jgi:hypothetical protein
MLKNYKYKVIMCWGVQKGAPVVASRALVVEFYEERVTKYGLE